jgi:hypothetical protein
MKLKSIITLFVVLITISSFAQSNKNVIVFAGNSANKNSGIWFGKEEVGLNLNFYKNFGLLGNVKITPPFSGVDRDIVFTPNLNLSYNINLLNKEKNGIQVLPYIGVNHQLPYKYRTTYAGEITNPKNTTFNYGLLINSNFYKGFGVYGNINADGVFLGISKRF